MYISIMLLCLYEIYYDSKEYLFTCNGFELIQKKTKKNKRKNMTKLATCVTPCTINGRVEIINWQWYTGDDNFLSIESIIVHDISYESF